MYDMCITVGAAVLIGVFDPQWPSVELAVVFGTNQDSVVALMGEDYPGGQRVMSRQAITAVCFDVFGTLLGYNGRRINPYRRLVQAEPGQKAQRLPFLTRDVGVDVFAEELGLSHLLPIIRHELAVELAGVQLFPEVAQVLRQLRAAGKRLAVCSNLAQEYGQVVRQLLPGLDAYVLSYEVGAAKPDPVIYSVVCETVGCRPRNVMFIGDSKRCDLRGPQAFGMQARWLDRSAGHTLLDAVA